jgi:IS30 family transposase
MTNIITIKELRKIRKLTNAGLSVRDISEVLKLTPKTIHGIIKEFGFQKNLDK